MEVSRVNLSSSPQSISPVFSYTKDDDRLSSLPDDIIYKILSFIGIKDAIKTCVLSSRWRYVWTSMPYLNFDLYTSSMTSKFVTDVLYHRSNLSRLSSLILKCSPVDVEFAKRVMTYAFYNNVQQVTLELFQDNVIFMVSLFIFKSLKHLTLGGSIGINFNRHASAWNLLALTTLHLDHVTFYNDNSSDTCIDLFPKCVNLKNLTLKYCTMTGSSSKGFRICHRDLSNLVITDLKGELFKDGYNSLRISTDSLHSLEKFDLCVVKPQMADAGNMFGLLQHLHGVKFLRLNLELVEIVSSSMKLSPPPPSSFTKLKSLKIYADMTRPHTPPNVSTEIKSYFLDSSPSASFTLISREDAMAMGVCTEVASSRARGSLLEN